MKKFLRKYRRLLIFMALIIGGSIFFVLQRKYNNEICSGVIINIENKDRVAFLDSNKVLEFLYKYSGSKVVGEKFGNLDLNTMEKKLNANPYVEKAEVYRVENDKIAVDIMQRYPIVRFMNKDGIGFYADAQGVIIPARGAMPVYVPVITGELNFDFDFENIEKLPKIADLKDSTLKSLFNLSLKISEDRLLSALIDQIEYSEDEVILIPKVGDLKILFGDFDLTDEKMEKLKVFYEEALPSEGWNKYTKLNLQYKNQIVCTLKN